MISVPSLDAKVPARSAQAPGSDAATLPPMLRRSHQLTGRRLKELLVDSGYVTGMDLAACAAQDVTLYGPWKAHDWSAPKARSQFSKDRFKWHGNLDSDECPAGHLYTPHTEIEPTRF